MDGSSRVHLRVSPGAAHSEVVGRHGDAWKVRVTAPATEGRANEAVLRLLAAALDLKRRDMEIVTGHGARDKIVVLEGIGQDELERRLGSAAAVPRSGKA